MGNSDQFFSNEYYKGFHDGVQAGWKDSRLCLEATMIEINQYKTLVKQLKKTIGFLEARVKQEQYRKSGSIFSWFW